MIRSLILLAILVAAGTQGKVIHRHPIRSNCNIVGGVDAAPGEFPSQLSFLTKYGLDCGASILSENWAITAGHCADDIHVRDIMLKAGSIYVSKGGTLYNVSQIIIHEAYNPKDDWRNDIALLKVSSPFKIDGVTVKPVSLPAQGENPPDGAIATVIGWGKMSESGPTSDILQKVDIPIINQKLCADLYNQTGLPIYDVHICAGLLQGGKDSCQGDSGGPLFVDGTLVGIVSWGEGCAEPNRPGVYTRVSSFIDWIREKTGASIQLRFI
ncbi:trypsin-1-like isoform X1 [Periplaneta americana]|uniref:trypsin-1-like isoform X1 n=1 Tax=Periplaneta americana TaxID=6978 RepID=UPI0037E8E393